MDIEPSCEDTSRSLKISAYGDTADEIEFAALDKAREFFGSTAKLHLDRTYQASSASGHLAAGDKKYYATIVVNAEGEG